MSNEVSYVCGLAFNIDMTKVALILKQKPDWQKGLLNGIGGKIEKDEMPYNAMVREFKEEAGIEVVAWERFVTMAGDGWTVYFYYATLDDAFDSIKTMESEEVVKINVADLYNHRTISNIQWLIPLAIDRDQDINYNVIYNNRNN